MLLADSHITMIVGVDVHVTTAPPFNPIHPYMGMVMDPADYIPFLGTNVSVNGLKRGVSDTGGMIIPLMHIPLAGPFAMASMIGHESMNFFASQTVFCDGSRMSPKGHMVMTCNDVGIPLSAGIGKNKAGKTRLIPSLFAPTSFSLPVPTGKPVMVGGPYVPDWGGMLTGLAASIGFSSLMKLGGKGLGKALKTFNHKVLKNTNIQKRFPSTKKLSAYLCRNGFEPVNLVNGAVVYEGTDFGFPSPLPLEWSRAWYSDSEYEGWLGHGVHCCYDRTVESFEDEGVTMLRMEDGRAVAFPLIAPGGEFYMRTERMTLRRTEKGYEAYSHDSLLTYRFDMRDGGAWRMTRIENPDGLHIQLRFSNGRFSGVSDPAGRTVHAATDTKGRVTSLSFVTDKGEERLVSYTYDESGNMTGITDAMDKTTEMSYSGHLMTEKTDRNGDTYRWEYDSKGRCVHTYGTDGMMEGRIEYHPSEGYNLVTDSTGGTTTYRYTPDQLVTSEIDPLGNETRHSYTDFMEPYRTIAPEGGVTGYSYDNDGNLTGVTYPDGSGEMYIYDDKGRLSIHVDREGNKTVRLYDTERPHLVSRFIDRDGGVTEFTHDSHGQPVGVGKGDRRSELSYDGSLNLVSWHEDGRLLGGWKHDARGRLIERSSPGNRTEFYVYDALDRLRRIDARDGNVIHLGYDSYDSITEARDARRHVRMGYNSVGSMTWREEGGNRVSFRYDGMDRLREVVNEAGAGYVFRRDLAGNISSEKDYGGIERIYHRDGCGRVTRIDRPGGRSTAYTYDTMGRVLTAEYHDGTKEEYGYDRNGLMATADNGEARMVFERDPMGRVTRETMGLPGGDRFMGVMSVESEYNAYGERTRVGSSLGADTELSYDRLGLVGGIKATVGKPEADEASAYGDAGGDVRPWESTIGRDDAGREVERFATGGIRITTDYNDMGLVRSRHVRSGNRHTGWRSYRWDVGARLMSMRGNLSPEPVIFDYDSMCNLVRGDYSMYESVFRTPDKVGNLYREDGCKGREYDRGGRLLWDGEYHYRYDCEGNLVHKSRRDVSVPESGHTEKKGWLGMLFSADDADNKDNSRETDPFAGWQPGDTCYEWQANGMLAGVRTPDGRTVTFGYDALGRRVSKRTGNSVHRFGWDGNVVLHEWDIEEADRPKLVTDETGREEYDGTEKPDNLVTWVYDGTSFTPVAKVTDVERYTIVHDYLSTPTQAYNSKGELVWEMLLDVYGKVAECHGDRTLVPFRYQGQYEDEETGLYYNRFRYYSPEMGIYISSDPIGLIGKNPTLYGYVEDVNIWLDIYALATVYLRNFEVYVGKAKVNAKSRYGNKTIATDIFVDIPNTDVAQGVEQIVYDRMLYHISNGNLDSATNTNNPVDMKRKRWRYNLGKEWLMQRYGDQYINEIDKKISEHYRPKGMFRGEITGGCN